MADAFEMRIYDFLKDSQFFPPEDIRAHQLHQLEQLVRFARHKVPFYHQRLAPLFDAADNFNFARWSELPLLRRQDLLTQRDSMLAPELPPGHGPAQDFVGSGTTGQSITIRQNRLAGLAAGAAQFRAWDRDGYDYGLNFFEWFGLNETDARWPDGRVQKNWGPPGHEGPRGTYAALHRLETVDRAFAFMQRHGASYASGRPHALFELAQYASKQGVPFRLKGLTGFGANISDTMREECLRVFGAPLRSLYAAKETYNIAHECAAGQHHINAELMLVEVLDSHGRPCPPGQRGRIIVTPFYTTAQPLIRYELGDEVSLGDGCRCGCQLPVLSELNGRSVHLFRLPGGGKISLRLPAELKKSFGALEWQVAQVAAEAIEIRYLKQRDALPHELEKIIAIVRQQMTPRTAVAFKPVRALAQTASGKVLDFICELPPEQV